MGEKTRSQIGRSNRDRGAAAERQVRDLFRALGFDAVRRGHVFDHESDVVGVPGIHIEVKYQKKPALWSWIYQSKAEAATKNDGQPVVWFRKPGENWHVIVTGKLFMEMYLAWYREQTADIGGTEDEE